jgi:hypothetical protein
LYVDARATFRSEPNNDADTLIYGSVIAYLFTEYNLELRRFITAPLAQFLISAAIRANFTKIEQVEMIDRWVLPALRLSSQVLFLPDFEREFQVAVRAMVGLPMAGNYISRRDLDRWAQNNQEQLAFARKRYLDDQVCSVAEEILDTAKRKIASEQRATAFPRLFADVAPDPYQSSPFEILRFYAAVSTLLGLGNVEASIIGSHSNRSSIGERYLPALMHICAEEDLLFIKDTIVAWMDKAYPKLITLKGLAPDQQMARQIIEELDRQRFPHCGAAVEAAQYEGTDTQQAIEALIQRIYAHRRKEWADMLGVPESAVGLHPRPIAPTDRGAHQKHLQSD